MKFIFLFFVCCQHMMLFANYEIYNKADELRLYFHTLEGELVKNKNKEYFQVKKSEVFLRKNAIELKDGDYCLAYSIGENSQRIFYPYKVRVNKKGFYGIREKKELYITLPHWPFDEARKGHILFPERVKEKRKSISIKIKGIPEGFYVNLIKNVKIIVENELLKNKLHKKIISKQLQQELEQSQSNIHTDLLYEVDKVKNRHILVNPEYNNIYVNSNFSFSGSTYLKKNFMIMIDKEVASGKIREKRFRKVRNSIRDLFLLNKKLYPKNALDFSLFFFNTNDSERKFFPSLPNSKIATYRKEISDLIPQVGKTEMSKHIREAYELLDKQHKKGVKLIFLVSEGDPAQEERDLRGMVDFLEKKQIWLVIFRLSSIGNFEVEKQRNIEIVKTYLSDKQFKENFEKKMVEKLQLFFIE